MRSALLLTPALIALAAAIPAHAAERVAVVNRSAMPWTLTVLVNPATGETQALTLDPGQTHPFAVEAGRAVQFTLRDWLGCEDFRVAFEVTGASAAGAAATVGYQLTCLKAGTGHLDSGCQWQPASRELLLQEDESPCQEALRKVPAGIKLQHKLATMATDCKRDAGQAMRALILEPSCKAATPGQVAGPTFMLRPAPPANPMAVVSLLQAASAAQAATVKNTQP